jgi:hypothetical protein
MTVTMKNAVFWDIKTQFLHHRKNGEALAILEAVIPKEDDRVSLLPDRPLTA